MQRNHSEELFKQYQTQYIVHDQLWNVFEAGSGTPIVFLHNGGGTLWNWAHQLQQFSSEYRVIAPDLPGFGRSHRPSEALVLDTYVHGLSKLLDILDCPRPILVGNCIGASIALEFSLRQPEKVAAVALFNICGGVPMLNPRLQFWATLRPDTALGRMLHKYMINTASHPNAQKLSSNLIYANREPVLHPMLRQFIKQQQLDSKLRASLYWLVMGLNSYNIFSQPRQRPASFPPVLLGWGAQNRTLDASWSRIVAKWLIPDHDWLIENAGHMPMYEQPELVNEMLKVFFENTDH